MPKATKKVAPVARKKPIPSIGRLVHYCLSAVDAERINRRRTTGVDLAARMENNGSDPSLEAWPTGAQAHVGNEADEGDVYPMLIVKTWGRSASSVVNGQVFLDGTDVYWATSVGVGKGPGTFQWPARS